MSYYDTKQALLTKLLGSSIPGITNNDIAFENNNFDPKNKALWLACYFIPATSSILGKTLSSGDEQRGVWQVSVFVSLDSDDYDNAQLQAIDAIRSEFYYNSSTVYNGQKVDILESTLNNGIKNESWFKRDLSINYLTYSTR
jgi:hypothetical protein